MRVAQNSRVPRSRLSPEWVGLPIDRLRRDVDDRERARVEPRWDVVAPIGAQRPEGHEALDRRVDEPHLEEPVVGVHIVRLEPELKCLVKIDELGRTGAGGSDRFERRLGDHLRALVGRQREDSGGERARRPAPRLPPGATRTDARRPAERCPRSRRGRRRPRCGPRSPAVAHRGAQWEHPRRRPPSERSLAARRGPVRAQTPVALPSRWARRERSARRMWLLTVPSGMSSVSAICIWVRSE